MSDRQTMKCTFVIDFSELVETEVSVNIDMPATAGLPYMLTVFCASVAELDLCFRVQNNIKSVLSWAYFETVIRCHGLDDIDVLTEKVYAMTKTDNARTTAEKLLAFLTPTGRICEELNGLEKKYQQHVIFAACVYHSLVTNKQIKANTINRLDYREMVTKGTSEIDERIATMLTSSLTMFDLLLAVDDAKARGELA